MFSQLNFFPLPEKMSQRKDGTTDDDVSNPDPPYADGPSEDEVEEIGYGNIPLQEGPPSLDVILDKIAPFSGFPFLSPSSHI